MGSANFNIAAYQIIIIAQQWSKRKPIENRKCENVGCAKLQAAAGGAQSQQRQTKVFAVGGWWLPPHPPNHQPTSYQIQIHK